MDRSKRNLISQEDWPQERTASFPTRTGCARGRMSNQILDRCAADALRAGTARARAPVMALTQRGESPRQAEVSPACDRRLLRRGDTGWGAAGGELPVRNTVH